MPQSGARVRFDIGEPPEQGAGERVDGLVGNGRLDLFRPRRTLLLSLLPDLPIAYLLDVGPVRAVDPEPLVEVRVFLLLQAITEFLNTALEDVVTLWVVSVFLVERMPTVGQHLPG